MSSPTRGGRHSTVLSYAGDARNTVEATHLDYADVQLFQEHATADSTRRGYTADWTAFSTWCDGRGVVSLPAAPMTVASYLAHQANLIDENGQWFYAPSTLGRWLASINKAHNLAGLPKPGSHPDVSMTLAGIRRSRQRPADKKAPLLLGDMNRALDAISLTTWPGGVIGHRDYAIVLLGWAGAFRRSELANLTLGDLTLHAEDGLHIRVRSSKTDQTGEGRTKAIPFGADARTCGPCAYIRWVRLLNAQPEGRSKVMPLIMNADPTEHVCNGVWPRMTKQQEHEPFLRPVMKNGAIKPRHISSEVINKVVKKTLEQIGVNPARFGAHSLRAGFVTQAFRNGANHHEVMRQTWHVNVATVEGYERDHAPLNHNAVTRLGL